MCFVDFLVRKRGQDALDPKARRSVGIVLVVDDVDLHFNAPIAAIDDSHEALAHAPVRWTTPTGRFDITVIAVVRRSLRVPLVFGSAWGKARSGLGGLGSGTALASRGPG